MPRVLTKTKNRAGAERNCGRCGKKIEPGDKYFTWEFRYGGKRFACADHYPRRSELTQSKMGQVYAAIEGAEDDVASAKSIEDVSEAIQSVTEEAQEVASEYQEAAEHFGGEGENAERADEVEELVQELEAFYPDEEGNLNEIRAEAEALLNDAAV